MQVTLPFAQFGVKGEHESLSEEDILDLRKLGSRLSFVWHNCTTEVTRSFFASRRIRYLSIPMGTGVRRFVPLYPTEHAVRDVAFVGGGQHRPHERRMLATVLNELGPQRVEVVGHGWEALGIPARHVGYGSEANRIYNSARICVNLHAPEQKLGPFRFVNNRVFDIAAAGRLQISDYPEGLSEHFSADKLSGVADEDWAVRVLEAVSIRPDDLDRIAARAREAVISRHTWRHQALAALEGLASAP